MAKISRNQPCPCGSGKKYKKCCYQKKDNKEITLSKSFGQNLPEGAVITNIPQKEKMSEVLLDFAKPLIDEYEDDKALYNALQISSIAWNASFFPPKERKKLIDESLNEHISDKNGREMVKEILLEMLRRKEKDFPNIKRMILDLQVSYKDGQQHLDVISTPANK